MFILSLVAKSMNTEAKKKAKDKIQWYGTTLGGPAEESPWSMRSGEVHNFDTWAETMGKSFPGCSMCQRCWGTSDISCGLSPHALSERHSFFSKSLSWSCYPCFLGAQSAGSPHFPPLYSESSPFGAGLPWAPAPAPCASSHCCGREMQSLLTSLFSRREMVVQAILLSFF